MLVHRSSGVVNFAHAAMGMYVAFAFFEFRATGDLVLPILGLPAMCSPQQILGRMEDGDLQQLGSWYDVGAIYAG